MVALVQLRRIGEAHRLYLAVIAASPGSAAILAGVKDAMHW